jgi:hypothetical protein
VYRHSGLPSGAELGEGDEEVIGQTDPTINKPMPPRKIHHQYVVSKEDGKWFIQSELIMDEEHFAK